MKTLIRKLFILPITSLRLALAWCGIDLAASGDLSLCASPQVLTDARENNLAYSLTVSSAGPDLATGVVVSNPIPSSVGGTSVSAGQLVIRNGPCTVNPGSLPAGRSVTFTVNEQATSQTVPTEGLVNPTDLMDVNLISVGLTWAAGAVGYTLQSTTNLVSPFPFILTV